jgi:hypothetical protein
MFAVGFLLILLSERGCGGHCFSESFIKESS